MIRLLIELAMHVIQPHVYGALSEPARYRRNCAEAQRAPHEVGSCMGVKG